MNVKITRLILSHTCAIVLSVIKEAMRLLLKKSGEDLVQRLKDEHYIDTYLKDEDDANYFATVTIPCFFGENNLYIYIYIYI